MPRDPGSTAVIVAESSGCAGDSEPGWPTGARRSSRLLRVLALATYPEEAASTRFRILQFVEPLADRGIMVDFRPFLTRSGFHSLYRRRASAATMLGLVASTLNRLLDLAAIRSADVVLVQREAMLFGPPVCEYVLARLWGKPMVLDLDDATYIPYSSPTYGRLTAFLKWFRKTDDLIRWSRLVVCGNRAIASHAETLGAATVVIPSVVDTELFHPVEHVRPTGPPVVGWIGSHSTFRYLESIFPTLERLGQTFSFRLLVVGSGHEEIHLPGVDVICRPWRLEHEIADFQEIDVGVYPIIDEAWALGKSGFKAIQYMAVGVPFIVSPVGACAEIGEAHITHFAASTLDQWHDFLAVLLGDPMVRARMGDAGRRHSLAHYTVSQQVDKLALTLEMAIEKVGLIGPDIQRMPPRPFDAISIK